MASYSFKNPKKLDGERFDKVIHALLAERVEGGVSKGMARKLIMIGAAYLNGSRCRIASKPVFGGIEVRVEYKADRLPQAQQQNVPELTAANILYHENGILVVNKPPKLPTVPTLDNARDNLVAALKRLLASRAGETKEIYLGIHHRLDAETSGCILFTTDTAMNVFAANLFQENLIQKEYLAVCTLNDLASPKKWEIKNELVRAEKKRNRYASTEWLAKQAPPKNTRTGEGSFAWSRFEILQTQGKYALVRAEPVTGRTHQLRVHLSEYGMPILGDRTYRGEEASRLMLHARRLEFRDPHGKDVVIDAEVPEAFKKLFATA